VFGAAAVKFRSTRSGAAWRSCLAGWFSSVCAGERRQCELSHQPRYPFAAHQDALTGQHGVDARRAVAAARPLPDRFNPLRHRRISHRPCRRLRPAAVVEGGHRFTDRGEQRRNSEGVTMCLRKGRDLRRGRGGLLGEKRARQPQVAVRRWCPPEGLALEPPRTADDSSRRLTDVQEGMP
jgi:hypothetical protein